jgi:hypothetical protein
MSIWTNIPDYDDASGMPIAKNTFYNAPSALLWLMYYNPVRGLVSSELFNAQLEAWFRGDQFPPTRDNVPGIWASKWLYTNRPLTRPYLDRIEGFQNLKKGEPQEENRTFNEKWGWLIQIVLLFVGIALLRQLWSFASGSRSYKTTSNRYIGK